MIVTSPFHFCPACGVQMRALKGHPWYFCNGCVARATDGDGQRLEFTPLGISGIAWRYAANEDGAWHKDREVLCLIDKRPVHVREARFGGVIAEPLQEGSAGLKGAFVDDLRIRRTDETQPLDCEEIPPIG